MSVTFLNAGLVEDGAGTHVDSLLAIENGDDDSDGGTSPASLAHEVTLATEQVGAPDGEYLHLGEVPTCLS